MLNPPELSEQIVKEATVRSTYERAQTALAMAKSESFILAEKIRRRAADLRMEADTLEAFLVDATKHTDSWYNNIVAECDIVQRILKD